MLSELTIIDFAIIDRLRLPLVAGFNVLTGETGAANRSSSTRSACCWASQSRQRGRARRMRASTGGRRVRSACCRPNCAALLIENDW